MTRYLFSAIALNVILLSSGCDPKPAPTNPTPAPANPALAAPSKPEASPPAGQGGAVIELGTTTVGELTVRASRDQGELKPGGDSPIDVWVTTTDGKPATVAMVRFWIGLEDAKASRKAKADIEDPKQPHHWHTHAEVPEPLMPDAKLWVEIEINADEKKTTSFDLKQ